MIYDFLESLKNFLKSRIFVLTLVFGLMFSIIAIRVFTLQVIQGSQYQENYLNMIHKTLPVQATRGNIYDCNGKLLAYNELSYNLTITDSGSYASTKKKNAELNAMLAEIYHVLRDNGENITNTFAISIEKDHSYSFNVTGTALNRFRADVFGRKKIEDLIDNKKLGFKEYESTPDQVIDYLKSDSKYQVDKSYDREDAYYIVMMRFAIDTNYYARYRATTLATDISNETIAYMNEHSDTLVGIGVEETTVRRYNDSVYFASMIGYTGRISQEEYKTLSATDNTYTANDVIGKSGLEQYYESYLRGQNGEKEVYINNLGKIIEEISFEDPIAGDDLYISIDSDLQIASYKLLEQEIAGIVYSNIKNGKIPADDVYFALINNNIVDITHFESEEASENEKNMLIKYDANAASALSRIRSELEAGDTCLNDMSDQVLDIFTEVMELLRKENLLLSSNISVNSSVYENWKAGNISPKEYLIYCISQQWIDSTALPVKTKYADSSEIYEKLCDFILEELAHDKEFSKVIYEYMIKRGEITGREICMALMEQGAVAYEPDEYHQISSGYSAYNFLLDKINNFELTPAQLALDPCTGSTVITDQATGEIKALVSYPGYDNNRLANGVDSKYYQSLREDHSNPQWNYATQEKTAPGSTFKMVTSTAALAEDIIDTSTRIQCTGKFLEVDNEPECWIYPKSTHANINVSEALRDSCNVFYYTLGFQLAQKDTGVYNDANGISLIRKYAEYYGLNEKSGIEIQESTPDIATQYPVMAAIGQSNNNYTTIALSRYVTAVTSGNLYNYQLMSRIVDPNGDIIDRYSSESAYVGDILNKGEWDAVHKGMRMVCENLDSFEGFTIPVAGKTGTAQQVETRPNHALFVGYAPYGDPEITIAVRISYGYSSHNAARAARNIFSYYFKEHTVDEILALKASGVNSSTSSSITD